MKTSFNVPTLALLATALIALAGCGSTEGSYYASGGAYQPYGYGYYGRPYYRSTVVVSSGSTRRYPHRRYYRSRPAYRHHAPGYKHYHR